MMANEPPPLPHVVLSNQDRIEICIPSRGRTPNAICLLQALRTQTFTRWDLTLLDDNPDDSLKSDFTLKAVLSLLEMEGHRCRIIRGEAAGPPHAHNVLLAATRKSLIARIDDDTLPAQTNYLNLLVDAVTDSRRGPIAAVGGPIPHFQGGALEDYSLPRTEDLAQFAPFEAPFIRYVHPKEATPTPTTTLYSSFVFNRAYFVAAGGYSLTYSAVAEKEETDILTRVQFLGAGLLFHPQALLWHLKAPAGGTRTYPAHLRAPLFQKDYENFVARMKHLRDGTFDWSAEAAANLQPFAKYAAVLDTDRGYIEL